MDSKFFRSSRPSEVDSPNFVFPFQRKLSAIGPESEVSEYKFIKWSTFSSTMQWSRGSLPGEYVSLGVHLPISRGTFIVAYSSNKLTLGHKNGVCLCSSKNLKVL